MKKKTFYFLVAIGAAIWGVHSCASVGTPVGGVSDFDPPVPQVYSPENYATNFQGDKITVTFDERIKYKDLSKQLVVSPPIKDIVMRIKPTAVLPTRRMEIDLSGIELLPNTTYTFNFGNAVGDNHEGAAIPNFKYVFSTGPQIDSLTVGGIVEDAFEETFDPNTVIMLYRIDTTFNDSTLYKERPMYFTRLANERDSTFLIENIAPGTYQLVALVDEASNMTYDQGKDKIAFFPRYIELSEPDPRGYRLRLALGKRPYKVYQGTNPQKGLIQMAIDGLEPQDSVLRIFPPLPEGAKDYYLFYPEQVAADEVINLLGHTSTTEYVDFSGGKLSLVVFKIDASSPLVNKTLLEITDDRESQPYRTVAISRDGETIIPRGSDQFKVGDNIYVIANQHAVKDVMVFSGKANIDIKNMMILGGSRIGARVAAELQDEVNIKLVDYTPEKAYKLAEQLEKTLIINEYLILSDVHFRTGVRMKTNSKDKKIFETQFSAPNKYSNQIAGTIRFLPASAPHLSPF